MKINGINNSFYGNSRKTNNQTNFTALKGIEYNNFFPKDFLEQAETVLAFKKSEPLKKFFEKYDGYAKFSKWFSMRENKDFASLVIEYDINPVSTKKEGTVKHIKKIIKKISSLVTGDIETRNHATLNLGGSGSNTEKAVDELTKEIQKLKFEDIERQILFNKKCIEQQKQDTTHLKNTLKEIKDLL